MSDAFVVVFSASGQFQLGLDFFSVGFVQDLSFQVFLIPEDLEHALELVSGQPDSVLVWLRQTCLLLVVDVGLVVVEQQSLSQLPECKHLCLEVLG